MARSEAQKAADRRYREAHKHDSIKWGTRLKPNEATEYDELLRQNGMTRADFVRWAIEELKRR